MGAKEGNKNARVNGKHPGMIIRLNTPTVDLLYDALALEGNPDPTRVDLQNAVYYAVQQIYGRKIEDQQAIIL